MMALNVRLDQTGNNINDAATGVRLNCQLSSMVISPPFRGNFFYLRLTVKLTKMKKNTQRQILRHFNAFTTAWKYNSRVELGL